MRRIFISDCEGPISKNDNAFEITKNFIPKGDSFFALISKYDDVLADILKKPGYNAGNTLKLILPFLIAYDVTDKQIEDFSAQNLLLITESKLTLSFIQKIVPAFIVSTSYEQYIRELCKALDFPFENTYSTRLSIDKYQITKKEKQKLKEITKEILELSPIELPLSAKNINDLSIDTLKTINRLDKIFWKEISNMQLSLIFSDVKPIGGYQKAEAIRDVIKHLNSSIENVIYFGDSITDIEALHLVNQKGGLAISFNGNHYAVKNSEVAVLSNSNLVTAILTDSFCKFGKQKTIELLENWSVKNLRKIGLDKSLLSIFLANNQKKLPYVQIVTSKNTDFLVYESNIFRQSVRGEAVGGLG